MTPANPTTVYVATNADKADVLIADLPPGSSWPELGRTKRCGCCCLKLAQGIAILPCKDCQPHFMAVLGFEPNYGS